MVKNHIKRINAPRRWDVLRKKHVFISRPNPGRNMDLALSLNTVLKEVIGKTKTTKESKYLLKHKEVLVNGKPRFDEKFPVGFLDVISFPNLNEHFRLLVNTKNKLYSHEISSEEAKIKLSKVLDKKQISGNKTQYNFTDGRNMVLGKDNTSLKDANTNDSIIYAIPGQQVKEILKLEKGCFVYLYKGKHVGLIVKVEDLKENNIIFKSEEEVFETKKAYAFVVGKNKPVISIKKTTSVSASESASEQEQKEQKAEEKDSRK